MRAFSILLVCLAVSATATAQKPAALFEGCQDCHGMPQPGVAGDDLWIGRIATTACVTPPGKKSEKQRSALVAWIRADARERPTVERVGRPADKGEGLVTSNIDHGSILLGPAGGVGDASVMVRLVWNGEKGSSKLRTVPVGKWEIRGYRVQRTADDGTAWQIWGAGNGGQKVVVKPGETATLDLDLTVRVKSRASSRRGKLYVGVGVTGDSGMGLTVVKKGDRVPATYALVTGDRAVKGNLAYG